MSLPDNNVHKRLNLAEEALMIEKSNELPIVNEDTFQPKQKQGSLPAIDRPAFVLLVVLYLLQGVPVGLAMGSVPFILKSKLSYSQVGVFSLAAYPYSLKLLWSPIVDAVYSKKVGRRRSWIIPIQTISGLAMLYLGTIIEDLLLDPVSNLNTITVSFLCLVFFCATQDIAVDGWALTVLLPSSLSYASTAQTIGLNTGYFLSFTVFLAFNSPDFANKYIRKVPLDEGVFTLGGYLKFWGWMYLLITLVLYFVPEEPQHLKYIKQHKIVGVENSPSSPWDALMDVYKSMFKVLRLQNVQMFVVILLIAKLGFQANEGATNLKLLEKGFSKEDLAITVLIDFPFEIIFGYYAGRWSTGKSPLNPWLIGFAGRLFSAALAQLVVYFFPARGVTKGYFIVVILQHLLGSFMSTIQFVSLCAFHTKIADPAIGGTYMTTLNTLSNFGGNWPKLLIFFFIDYFTKSDCISPSNQPSNNAQPFPFKITDENSRKRCTEIGGIIKIERDGYFYTNFICISLGIIIFFWVKKKVRYLQSLPNSQWRVEK